MRQHPANRVPRRPFLRRSVVAVVAVGVATALSGCGEQVGKGFLPSERDTTNQTGRIMELWNGSWLAALAVGVLVWGLILWSVVVYRRRRDATDMPEQVRYHLPLEITYTVVPLLMIAVLFFFTARDQAAIADTSARPDLRIEVVGKQWSWDFNHLDEGVYETGVQAELTGEPGAEAGLPTLYLPVNERVEFLITSRDVIHSFWIPAFLYKLDAIPGIVNTFQVVPQRVGTYRGKCAELCGEYHSEMLFNVRVVPRGEYDAHLAELRAKGQVGRLGADLGGGGTASAGTEHAGTGAAGTASAATGSAPGDGRTEP
ncbi:MAG: cytochrome c oxidase subunit II [Actinomycetales bacterium]|nr:cytochrome c oxidase subunit II [Actinomycetales bacterium]